MRMRAALIVLSIGLLVPGLATAQGAPEGDETETVTPSGSAPPKLVIKGFGDVNFRLFKEKATNDDTRNSFFLGQIDLFLTSQLAERVSVLAELVAKFRTNNDPFYDVDRIHITYHLSDTANIRLGKMHAALGYWNQTYHHGAWFQTTAARPEIYLFNGILPIHLIGIELYGTKALGPVDIDYTVSAGNGRGKTLADTTNVSDFNNAKAVNVLASIAPAAIPGFKIGGDLWLDTIPPGDTATRVDSIKERLWGVHAVYLNGPVELLAEYFEMNHVVKSAARPSYDAQGAYAQAAYQISAEWKPYYRFDYQNVESGNPYLTAPGRLQRHTVGARWDPFTWNGLKLELSAGRRDGHNERALLAQTAFTF